MSVTEHDIDPASLLGDISVLVIEVDGRRLVYAAPTNGRDPMEMTLGEWRRYPVLSGAALLNDFLARKVAP